MVKAIDSVLNQGFIDHEIIVVDDGSTDNTWDALQHYAGKFRYIHQENSGVSCARNAGIRAAQGDWVAFLDSDDEWEKDYLSVQMEHAGTHPSAVAHATNVRKVQMDGKTSDHFAESKFVHEFAERDVIMVERPLSVILNHQLWWLQSCIIRRDILTQAGLFDTRLSIGEDLDLLARVALRGAFTFCSGTYVRLFRRVETLKSLADQGLDNGAAYYQSLGGIYDQLSSSEEITAAERRTIDRLASCNWREQGNLLLITGLGPEARNCYTKSFMRCPCPRSAIKMLAGFLPGVMARSLITKRFRVLRDSVGGSRGR